MIFWRGWIQGLKEYSSSRSCPCYPPMGFLLDIILAAAGCCLPSSACQALMGGLSSWEEGDYGGLLP